MDLINHLAIRGTHEAKIRELFPAKLKYEADEPVFNTPLCLIAFSNRSGSNLLADYLRSTGKMAGFFEQLNHETVVNTSRKIGARTFPEYIKTLAGDSDGKIFGFKASWDQIAMLLRARIDRMFSGVRIIHIRRRDVLAQAVSFSIADTTKQWTSRQKPGEAACVSFNYDDISGRISGSMLANAAISYLCDLFELPCLEIAYEDLIQDPQFEILKVGAFLDLQFDGWRPVEPSIKRQFGEMNRTMIDQFKARSRAGILA